MKGNYTVYMHIAPNTKKYIGITKRNPIKRWGHNGYCYKHNEYFARAIMKYGWDNIKHEILFTHLTKEEAEHKEIELIAKYKTTNKEYGYNIENGGNCYGTHSEETKIKIGKANKGHRHTEETKQKISKLRKGSGTWNKGIHWSDEYKIKNALSQKRTPVFCIETKIYYYGISDAERKTGIDKSSIARCCKGQVPRAGGYHWSYASEKTS